LVFPYHFEPSQWYTPESVLTQTLALGLPVPVVVVVPVFRLPLDLVEFLLLDLPEFLFVPLLEFLLLALFEFLLPEFWFCRFSGKDIADAPMTESARTTDITNRRMLNSAL